MVRSQRVFLVRAVDYLVREAGIRQFLDIGTGIPSLDNVHEVAQRIAPECRILYVDNDPIVLAHARALMTSTEEGRTAFILADLRQPQAILDDPALRETLDLANPVALFLVGVLHHLHDSEDPLGIVRTLLDALPSGSYFVLTQPTGDFDPSAMAGMAATAEQSGIPYVPRGRPEVEAMLDGLTLVDPGIVPIPAWNPRGLDYPGSAEVDRDPYSVYGWAAVARKP
jgi:SAM-dependent methyltransferase